MDIVGEGGAEAVRLCLGGRSRPWPEFPDDPTLDFTVRATAAGVGGVEVSVRTWAGDGLDAFLHRLAEDFRGWDGARTWRSLEGDLTLSAAHASGGRVHLAWGLHGGAPAGGWRFEATTVHAAGEDMRHLADGVREFLAPSTPVSA
ncbi:DUF6228 family protein [Streptomyces sp. NPDC032472]|uniref:DUF6228 family protein n=1 Tax=Streptomyces sp. NPDC032472 TaxID=3155018 RepID=UPI0033D25007